MSAPEVTVLAPEPPARKVERAETVIIGAGQAGLATAYHLQRLGRPCVLLEADQRVGDVWRRRFDSLRLFSPARYDGLPGLDFPAPGWSFPTGREMGDYLERYAAHFGLPVETGVEVDGLDSQGDGYIVSAGERRYEARSVVVASGTFQRPITPGFATELDPGIRQLHSSDYRNPSQLQAGPALVVGASHSGSDIAYEVAASHPTTLAGPIKGELPFRIDGRPARAIFPTLWFLANHVLTMRTPIGRKARPHIRSEGGPLIRYKRADLKEAGVEHVETKVVAVEDGRPALEGGRVLDVTNVIWCTGFDKDVRWIRIPVAGDDGWPEQERGAAAASPGLYFVGLPFLHAFASMLVGGVGRDAKHVAQEITRRARRP
jgi:putative flavoprotein involved in K+ transport